MNLIRLIFFFVLVLALAGLFAWVADMPATVTLNLPGMQAEVSLLVALVAIVALIGAVMILWWLLKGIIGGPERLTRHFRSRKRDRGYQALSTGMIAIGAGDSGLARKMNARASQNLDPSTEPLLYLLDAQTSLLEGNHSDARRKFETMLDDPETRPLGLHGLYLEAQTLGETRAARHFAELAAKDAPQLGWASRAAMEARTAERDWDGALKLLDRQMATKQIPKDEYKRQRAVLMTAKSMEIVDTDPSQARSLASEAASLEPDFVPATLAHARAAIRKGDTRSAGKVLEAAWRRDPHPQVGDLYLHLRPGDPVQDRLARARKLEQWKPQNPVAATILARALYEAGDHREARETIEPVIRTQPSEGAFLLLADIEDEQTGDQGRVRHWLAQAVKAPRDPAWTTDGYISEHWAPISPVTGRLDAFEWKVPVEQVLPMVDGKPVGAFEYDATVPVIPKIESQDAIPESRSSVELRDVSLDSEEIEPDAVPDDSPQIEDEAAAPAPVSPDEAASSQGTRRPHRRRPYNRARRTIPVRPARQRNRKAVATACSERPISAMFERLAEIFRGSPEPSEETRDHEIRRAAAALLVILMDADGVREPEEEARLRKNLGARFGLDDGALARLVKDGKTAAAESADFYAFTSVLKNEFDFDERNSFIGMLWEMAYADGVADELEDNLVWRISELMGVAGRERIFQRQEAAERLGVPVRQRSDLSTSGTETG